MDSKINLYRKITKQAISQYEELLNRRPEPGQETQVVFDEERDHYILHTIGWEGTKRVWNTTLYVRIREGKVWIEIDWTENGIATDLLEAGVPKEDIVLAFHHPQMRQYTEFAVV
jgi:hypothetical protein